MKSKQPKREETQQEKEQKAKMTSLLIDMSIFSLSYIISSLLCNYVIHTESFWTLAGILVGIAIVLYIIKAVITAKLNVRKLIKEEEQQKKKGEK